MNNLINYYVNKRVYDEAALVLTDMINLQYISLQDDVGENFTFYDIDELIRIQDRMRRLDDLRNEIDYKGFNLVTLDIRGMHQDMGFELFEDFYKKWESIMKNISGEDKVLRQVFYASEREVGRFYNGETFLATYKRKAFSDNLFTVSPENILERSKDYVIIDTGNDADL